MKLSMRRTDVEHQNERLNTLNSLILDITLMHRQQYLHFISMKQSTSESFVLRSCVQINEVVILQKEILVELHQTDLLPIWILSNLTLESPFLCNFRVLIRKDPQNDPSSNHDMTFGICVCFL